MEPATRDWWICNAEVYRQRTGFPSRPESVPGRIPAQGLSMPPSRTVLIRIRPFVVVMIALAGWGQAVSARDIFVDPGRPSDPTANRFAVPSIRDAVRAAKPGDTIHLSNQIYRDTIELRDLSGTPEQPIVFDGHGAILNGCDPLELGKWVEVSPGLYRSDDLMPLTQAIVDRWFFLIDGQLQRMERCSKGPSLPLKPISDLKPGEWTFELDQVRTKQARPGYIHGSFYLRTPGDQPLEKAGIEYPRRMAGVSMHGHCAHLIVRNVTATRVYNDGFNLSDCVDCRFEKIAAIDCADDGISAHGACRYSVEGFVSIGNATGICDTGSSVTSYRRVLIRDCIGFDLFFLDTGTYTVRDALVDSSAAKAVFVLGKDASQPPCRLSLENVLVRRLKSSQELRVNENCVVTLNRVTLDGLDMQTVGGSIVMNRSRISGMVPAIAERKEVVRPPRIHRWPATRWSGSDNVYAVESIRVADHSYSYLTRSQFFDLNANETNSRWVDPASADRPEPGIGASFDEIKLPNPPDLPFGK